MQFYKSVTASRCKVYCGKWEPNENYKTFFGVCIRQAALFGLKRGHLCINYLHLYKSVVSVNLVQLCL